MANLEYAGSALYASWVYSGGAGTISLHLEQRNFVYTPTINFIDATAGADVSIRRINSFRDASLSIETLAQSGSTGAGFMTAFAEGIAGTLTWGEAGSAAANPKHTAAFISQGVVVGTPYNDVVTYSVTLQQDGDRTDTTW